VFCWPRSSIGIATDYGLEGLGIGSRCVEIFRRPDLPWGYKASCTMGKDSFPGVESGRSATLTPHPLLVPRSIKQSRAIPLLSLRAFVAYRKDETYLLRVLKMYCSAVGRTYFVFLKCIAPQ